MKIRPVSHEDRLTLIEHLDELRARLIVSLVVFGVAFGICLWQNHLILDLLNEPLPGGREPITFGVTEPFMTTLTVSAYAAMVLALPVLLYQLYAFVLPAFTPNERRVAFPLLAAAPALFIGGVVFGYTLMLPKAVDFLLNFNQSEFNIQVRARDYYSFVVLALAAPGVLFQMPLVILAITRLGITTPRQLRHNRRYALVAISVVALLFTPGTDPVTMLILMAPLLVLYELSIVLASVLGRPSDQPVRTPPAPEGPR
jgi:sec-independent protein translocase protein TatC